MPGGSTVQPILSPVRVVTPAPTPIGGPVPEVPIAPTLKPTNASCFVDPASGSEAIWAMCGGLAPILPGPQPLPPTSAPPNPQPSPAGTPIAAGSGTLTLFGGAQSRGLLLALLLLLVVFAFR
jgi:hypothetical protein